MQRFWSWLRAKLPERHEIGRVGLDRYLTRYVLYGTRSGSGRKVFLHVFHHGDAEPYFHDHPWSFWSLILWGGYYEITPADQGGEKCQGVATPSLGSETRTGTPGGEGTAFAPPVTTRRQGPSPTIANPAESGVGRRQSSGTQKRNRLRSTVVLAAAKAGLSFFNSIIPTGQRIGGASRETGGRMATASSVPTATSPGADTDTAPTKESGLPPLNPGETRRWYGPGRLLRRPAEWRHRVELPPGKGCITLLWVGPKIRSWGFWCRSGWIPWREHESNQLAGLPGCGDS